jgi:hypothetical protein
MRRTEHERALIERGCAAINAILYALFERSFLGETPSPKGLLRWNRLDVGSRVVEKRRSEQTTVKRFGLGVYGSMGLGVYGSRGLWV